jgi:hypothetical protein
MSDPGQTVRIIDGDRLQIAGTWSLAGYDLFRRRKDGPSAIPTPLGGVPDCSRRSGVGAWIESVDGVLASRT